MLQLDLSPIQHSFTALKLDPSIIIDFLLIDTFLEHIMFVLVGCDLFVAHLLYRFAVTLLELLVQLPVPLGLVFAPHFPHRVVSKFGHHQEDHGSSVIDHRGV